MQLSSSPGMFDISCGQESVPVMCRREDEKYLKNFKYTTTNFAGSGADKCPSEITYKGCNCGMQSCPSDCPCISRFGANYDRQGHLMKDLHSHSKGTCNSKPIAECNSMCKCGEGCINRLVQNGITHKLEVIRTKVKGWGVRASEGIHEREFVCEYAGEIIGIEEGRKRTKSLTSSDMNYVLLIREVISEGGVINTLVDPRHEGNIGRFINHSCDPNLAVIPVRIDNNLPRVAFFAVRNIPAGEELCYSYGNTCGSVIDLTAAAKMLAKPCSCNSVNCTGYLPYGTL